VLKFYLQKDGNYCKISKWKVMRLELGLKITILAAEGG
jgi:hypothetical protein